MSDTPRTDFVAAVGFGESHIESLGRMQSHAQILERELAEAQGEIVRRRGEAQYFIQRAIDAERELGKAKKDSERYRYVRSIWGLPDEKFNDEIDAAMKECGK